MADKFSCYLMQWDEVQSLAKAVARKIIKSGYQPDAVIGLARGGWVHARLLCDLLGIKDLYSVKVSHWGVTATVTGKAELGHGLDLPVAGKNVLIVDDITDTGESLELAKRHVEGLGTASVRTAALEHIDHSKFVPDYFGKEIRWKWVIFPWNYTEDLCNLAGKVKGEDGIRDAAALCRKMAERFELKVPEEDISDVLVELEGREHLAKKKV